MPDLRITVDGSELKIHLGDLLELLDDDGKRQVAECLAFDEALLSFIMDAVADSEPRMQGSWWPSSELVNDLRARLLPLMDSLSASLVRYLLRQVACHRIAGQRWLNHAHDMENQWPKFNRRCEHCGEWTVYSQSAPPRPADLTFPMQPPLGDVQALLAKLKEASDG